MSKKASDKAEYSRLISWVNGYIHLTATVVALVGFFLLSTAWATRTSTDRWFSLNDPLLGMSNRALLVLRGLVHVTMAAYLFAGRDLLNRTLAVLWLGINHLIYYMGLLWTERTGLLELERFLGWRMQLQPDGMDLRWKILQGYLIVVSAGTLVLIWRHYALLKKEAWFTQWRESRAHPPKAMPASSRKSKADDDYTKIVCAHCGQKIAFPLSRGGESVACPGCGQRVLLSLK